MQNFHDKSPILQTYDNRVEVAMKNNAIQERAQKEQEEARKREKPNWLIFYDRHSLIVRDWCIEYAVPKGLMEKYDYIVVDHATRDDFYANQSSWVYKVDVIGKKLVKTDIPVDKLKTGFYFRETMQDENGEDIRPYIVNMADRRLERVEMK